MPGTDIAPLPPAPASAWTSNAVLQEVSSFRNKDLTLGPSSDVGRESIGRRFASKEAMARQIQEGRAVNSSDVLLPVSPKASRSMS